MKILKKIAVTFCEAVFLTRPLILIPVWGFFILGYYRAAITAGSDRLSSFSLFGLNVHVLLKGIGFQPLAALLALTAAAGSAYVLNQIADRETDKANGGMPLLVRGGVSVKLAMVETVVLTAVSIGFGIHRGGPVLIFIGLILIFSLFYNLKPFRFSGRPILDFLTNATGCGFLAFGIGWIAFYDLALPDLKRYLLNGLPYFFLTIPCSVTSCLPDEEGDRTTGKITTLIRFGRKKANLISLVSLVLGFAMGWIVNDMIPVAVSAASLPFFFRYQFTGRYRHGMFCLQVCSLFLILLIVLVYPWYLFFCLVPFVLMRIYYKTRHGIDFPVSDLS